MSQPKKPTKNMLVTQSNCLVEARYSLSLYEQRLVLIMISMIEPDDEDFKDYVIKVSDFRDLLGLKNNNLYSQIKLVLKKLIERSLFIPLEDKSYLMSNWISDAEYKNKEGVVLLSLSKKLKPYLLFLKSNFTKQRLSMVIQFNGVYTIRIYTLLKQYERIGKRVFEIEEFKKILGIEHKYTLYANLKARTIMQAKKEFKKKDKNGDFLSDINFKLETIKMGRKITHLKFIIIKQNVIKKETVQNFDVRNNEIDTVPEIIIEYEKFGVMRLKTEPFYEKRGEQNLVNTLDYFKDKLKKGKKVENKGAYLFTLLTANAGQEIVAERKEVEEKERKMLETLHKEQEEREKKKRLEAESKHLNTVRKAYLSFLSKGEKQQLLEELKEKYEDKYGDSSLIKKLESGFISVFLDPIIKDLPQYKEDKEEMIKIYMKEIK